MSSSRWYRTSPPAKLNLFLEILSRREDGFHELDTVMTAIDWRDELWVQHVAQPGVRLQVDWSPDRASVAKAMQVSEDDALLHVPTDERNLVVRALQRLTDALNLEGGWDVRLHKQIPSGAGMGGASSDAAAALRLGFRAAAEIQPDKIAGVDRRLLTGIAAEIGSDVPFFLGISEDDSSAEAARATGRGEKLSFFSLANPLHAVVIFPAASVSTPAVYSRCTVPEKPRSSVNFVRALQGMGGESRFNMHNALQGPACGLSSRIDPPLKWLSDAGLTDCQMTGSGSACFALASSSQHAANVAETLRSTFPGGALIRSVVSCVVPSEIHIA
ncbi:4-(cytidine 5'-diphospho)-2-C-methyl-D-erythritol kinase [Rhodopirellula sp. JC740]|uniref:4-diphosphocytidyl-2-C-methyl-D-erythritol kinase n=1 Tax=Rhodopirellula halodulae TaxID=2894198 RepID=A0ABS8NFS1_9BACT|nr:4-(cytidine 5'-diphospho)-2-C-methyl-D-erythritol kinase [Rhodopirellula sp. JC740]